MKNILYVWKPVGITPFEVIENIKQKNTESKNEIISYAGRLDPMAEGILILLIGEENKNRDKYLDFIKEYESEVVIGITTDTFDSLGLVTDINFKQLPRKEIENKLKSFLGIQKQLYPPYSSKAVNGKPLFWWARQGRLSEIKIPEREIEIYSMVLLEFEKIEVSKFVKKILSQIKKVNGDFRKDEIMETWEKFSVEFEKTEFIKIKIKVSCSTGTYIRRIADDIGGFAYTIKRTKVGDVEEKDCIKIT